MVNENELKSIVYKFAYGKFAYKLLNDPYYHNRLLQTIAIANHSYNPEIGVQKKAKKRTYIYKAVLNCIRTIANEMKKEIKTISMNDDLNGKNVRAIIDRNTINKWSREYHNKELYQNIVEDIEKLPYNEKVVMKRTFLEGVTLEQVGKELAYTAANIALIQKSAIKRLKERYG